VAVRAYGLGRVEFFFGVRLIVAVSASLSELGDAFGMRVMAGNALGFCARGTMRRGNVRVTPRAGAVCGSAHSVRLMAACAIAMRSSFILREDLGFLVAGRAPECGGGREGVRLMAGRARIVTTIKSCCRRNHGFTRLVTFHAGCRLRRELVASVAVCAGATEPRASVPDVHLVVALVAFPNGFHGWFVRVVAGLAGKRRVRREPGTAFRLERPVAARAVPTPKDVGLRLEDMASVAIHGHAIEIDVRKRSLSFMALCADPRIGSVEGGLARVVTLVALHFFLGDHVCVVPG